MGILRQIHRQRGIVTVICAYCLIVLMPLMAQAGRDRVLLDAGWKFALDGVLRSGSDPSAPSYDASHWRRIDVPHDYVIEQPFTKGLDPQHASLPTPAAWYRKTILIPASERDQDVWLDFDGLFRDAKIYVNGKFVVEHQSGYVPAHIDISLLAAPGMPLTIAVHVDPSKFEGWWYEGGGIYRHVWLTFVSRLHIEHDGVWVVAKTAGNEAHPDSANVHVHVSLKNSRTGRVRCRLLERVVSPSGKIVASRKTDDLPPLLAGAATVAEVSIPLPRPLLWSLDKPNLYRLISIVEVAGSQIDRVETTFGIRTVRFDPNKGFFLNGRPVKIKGFCNHQDFAGIGIAVPDNLEYWRVKKMLALGANAWRTAHNPPTESLLDACDRLGMLVLDENRHLGETYAPKTVSADTPLGDLADLSTMIVRDRNHPCIFAWSLCNEESLQGTTAGADIVKAMVAAVHTLDPTRLVTTAMNGNWGSGFSLVEDLQGFNYFAGSFADFHKNFPKQPMIFTESTSAVSDRGVYQNDWGRGYVGSYTQPVSDGWPDWLKATEDRWTPIAVTDYLSGDFVWTGFDYMGEPSPFGWPDVTSHFGVLDLCGFPKDDAYYYIAYWGRKPLVHITPHWNWPGSEGKPIQVVVFSSASKVDLSLNGVSLGKKECPYYGDAEWTVNYEPGTLTARGYDTAGRLVAEDSVYTAGAPYQIQLRTDLPVVTANGEDESVIEAAIRDRNGNLVPTAGSTVFFTISGEAGRIAGTGSGDPCDHTQAGSPSRAAFSGRLAAVIRSTGQRGLVTVTATGEGLQPAKISLRFR